MVTLAHLFNLPHSHVMSGNVFHIEVIPNELGNDNHVNNCIILLRKVKVNCLAKKS